MKLKTSKKKKNTIKSTKWQPTEFEKIFTHPKLDRMLISKIYEEFKERDIKKEKKKPNNQILMENSQQRNLKWPRSIERNVEQP